ncbi:MAG: aminotransferase class V-fold PLP-dependent enzyme [Chloroflexi bacterium]|nr:aminotransferase class V-fold PLP-dependent enzyme [Chloroflexota bacterium]
MKRQLTSIRNELPVTENVAYLNTGMAGPLPRRTVQIIAEQAQRQLLEGRSNLSAFREEYLALLDDLRARFARLLGAGHDEIALTHHTTEGMNIALWGLNWQAGDEIVTTTLEHVGGLLPGYAVLRRFGLTLRMVDLGLGDGDIAGKIAAALSPRTRLVVVSHVSYKTGALLPVAEIAQAVHSAGALIAVDGVQAAGVIPVDVRALDADFYAIAGHKWLCGPEGVGALYVRRKRVAELSPTFVGFFSMRDFEAFDFSGSFIPAPGAHRYETGTLFWPAIYGMRESLQWLEEVVGYDTVFAFGREATARCRQMLGELPGCTIHTPANHAGLTTFSVEGVDAVAACDTLADQGVIIRSLSEQGWMRASTGFFNSADDLQRLREGLSGLSS